MRYRKEHITVIRIPTAQWHEIITHCRRKLQGNYIPGEGQAPKAFGLVGGRITGSAVLVEAIIPLIRNARDCGEKKQRMDRAMDQYGIPSETPFEQRGWVAEQEELDHALHLLQGRHLRLVGNYHMHRVAWKHDPRRETPTELDTVLGKSSRMFMFIISMVNPDLPVIRAFFEGINDLEVPVEII